jgi:hypothetical protein
MISLTLALATMVLGLQLKASHSTVSQKCHLDENTNQTIQWVNASVPVEIIQLFLSNGLCSAPLKLPKGSKHAGAENRKILCDFVGSLADQYANATTMNKYVEKAMGLMHERANKEAFNCSDLRKIKERKESLKLNVVAPPKGHKILELYQDVTEKFIASETPERCKQKCQNQQQLCEVAATLTDLTLEKVNPGLLFGLLYNIICKQSLLSNTN